MKNKKIFKCRVLGDLTILSIFCAREVIRIIKNFQHFPGPVREEAAIIMGSLSPDQYIHIENKMDDTIAMWYNLKNMHQSQGANSHYH